MARVRELTSSAGLEATLAAPLPDPLELGGGTVVALEGTCERADRGTLELVLGTQTARVDGPLPPTPGDRCGRWHALLPLPAALARGPARLLLRGSVGGELREASLAETTIVGRDPLAAPPAPSISSPAERPLIAICMATHEPGRERLEQQVESIRAQDWPSWVCLVSDDASSPAGQTALREVLGDDERFLLSRSDLRLGFYRNFERALRMVPAEAGAVALADQDDRWRPEKLSATWSALADNPRALLAYSDLSLVDERGATLAETFFAGRRNSYDDIVSMLVANTVTGAASLFRPELLPLALPFPPPYRDPYHDHWLALCALAAGEIAYLDRPTYERLRTAGSVTSRQRSQRSSGGPGARAHFERYLQLLQFARVLDLRLGDRIEPRKRRALGRFEAARHSLPAGLWLGARSLRRYLGRDETLGRERALLAGILWHRLAGVRALARRQ